MLDDVRNIVFKNTWIKTYKYKHTYLFLKIHRRQTIEGFVRYLASMIIIALVLHFFCTKHLIKATLAMPFQKCQRRPFQKGLKKAHLSCTTQAGNAVSVRTVYSKRVSKSISWLQAIQCSPQSCVSISQYR